MSCAEHIQQHLYQKETEEENMVHTIEEKDFLHPRAKDPHTTNDLRLVQTKVK